MGGSTDGSIGERAGGTNGGAGGGHEGGEIGGGDGGGGLGHHGRIVVVMHAVGQEHGQEARKQSCPAQTGRT